MSITFGIGDPNSMKNSKILSLNTLVLKLLCGQIIKAMDLMLLLY